VSLLLLELLLELLLLLLLLELLLLLLLLLELLSFRLLLLLSELRSTWTGSLRLSSFRSTSRRACACVVVDGERAVTQSNSNNGATDAPVSLLRFFLLIGLPPRATRSGFCTRSSAGELWAEIYTPAAPFVTHF